MKTKPIKPSKEQLQEAFNRLLSVRKVAKEFNCSGFYIKSFMKEYEIEKKILSTNNMYSHDQDFFSRDTEESFYIAGFILADGCVKKGHGSKITSVLGITITIADRLILEQMRDAMKVTNPLVINPAKKCFGDHIGKPKIALVFAARKMCSDLLRFGIVERKTYQYTFPEWLKTHPLIKHFLRGLMDGDGHVGIHGKKKTPHLSICGTEDTVKSFREILIMNSLIQERNGHIRNGHGCWEFGIGGTNVVGNTANFLYKDAEIYMKRKYDIAMEQIALKTNGTYTVKFLPSKEELLEIYNELGSMGKAAKKFGFSMGTIRKLIKEYNIPVIKR